MAFSRPALHLSQSIRNIITVPPLKCMGALTLSHMNSRRVTKKRIDSTISNTFWLHTMRPTLKVFEPDYLDAAGLVPPTYPAINIQVKGYDFEILESFQSYIHNLAENIGIDVCDAWATPATDWNIYTYAEESTAIKDTYTLHLFERNIQLANVQTTDLPILIDVVRKTLPEGVRLSVHEHQTEHKEARFIPDPFIEELQRELNQLEAKKQENIARSLAEKAAKGKLK